MCYKYSINRYELCDCVRIPRIEDPPVEDSAKMKASLNYDFIGYRNQHLYYNDVKVIVDYLCTD